MKRHFLTQQSHDNSWSVLICWEFDLNFLLCLFSSGQHFHQFHLMPSIYLWSRINLTSMSQLDMIPLTLSLWKIVSNMVFVAASHCRNLLYDMTEDPGDLFCSTLTKLSVISLLISVVMNKCNGIWVKDPQSNYIIAWLLAQVWRTLRNLIWIHHQKCIFIHHSLCQN